MPSFSIGVDLGGTNLRIAAIRDDGTLLEKITAGTEVGRGRDRVINEMCEAIRALAGKYQDGNSLHGVGVGVPGIIDLDSGMLRESPNLPGWHNYPVREEIERRLGAPVILENDANVAALGEKWMGAGREVDSLCMITLGTGVGGGIVLQGQLWHGMTGMAGEAGHATVDPRGHLCGCSNHGCLEQFASATAIRRMATEASASGKAPELRRALAENPEFGAKLIYQMAIQGERAAQEIFRRVGWALGINLAALINIFNLPMYIIGGGVANSWDAFAPAMFAEVRKRSMVYRATDPDSGPRHKTIITRTVLGGDAGLYGAARLPALAAPRVRRRRQPARTRA